MQAFVVEDHERLRRLIVAELARVPGTEVVGDVGSAEEALEQVSEDTDLVLVDLSLPKMNGIALIKLLVGRYPDLVCLVVTSESDDLYVQHAFKAGAKGYLNKEDIMDLEKAVLTLARGETFVSAVQKRAHLSDAGQCLKPYGGSAETRRGKMVKTLDSGGETSG